MKKITFIYSYQTNSNIYWFDYDKYYGKYITNYSYFVVETVFTTVKRSIFILTEHDLHHFSVNNCKQSIIYNNNKKRCNINNNNN